MKIRTGFVSNSSSSSFVIATRRGEACPHCGRSDQDLLEVLDEDEYGESYIRYQDGPGLREYINEIVEDHFEDPESPPADMDRWDQAALDLYHAYNDIDKSEWKVAAVSLDINQSRMWGRLMQQAQRGGSLRVLYGSF